MSRTRRTTFTAAELRRFVRVAAAEGLGVAVEKRLDGSQRLLTTKASGPSDDPGANEWDEVLAR